jgi:hypothetical protein
MTGNRGIIRLSETPPRAWGRQSARQSPRGVSGNTPTGRGEDKGNVTDAIVDRKHPHGRGEDEHQNRPAVRCAGNTPTASVTWRGEDGEDPHLAWEDRSSGRDTPRAFLQSPGTQRVGKTVAALRIGNTPTGVGKTSQTPECTRRQDASQAIATGRRQKHPHGRGEDSSVQQTAIARRVMSGEKHPHGRGEDSCSIGSIASSCVRTVVAWVPETPPRAWGRPDGLPMRSLRRGLTEVETPPRAWGRR